MSTTTFTDESGGTQGTLIVSDWLNDVDFLVYNVFNGKSSVGADGVILVSDGTNFVEESGNTARTSLGLGTGDNVTHANLTATGTLNVTGITTHGGNVI